MGSSSSPTGRPLFHPGFQSRGHLEISGGTCVAIICLRESQFSSFPSGTLLKSSAAAIDQAQPKENGHVFCGECRTQLGLFSPSSPSVTLFKWQITCETVSTGRAPSISECLAASLLAAISRSACAKSVVLPYEDRGSAVKALHLWVLNANLVYTSSARQGKRAALKILYRDISIEEAHGLADSMTSDVQEMSLPSKAIKAVRRALEASSALMPERERCFRGWSAGLLDRWSVSNSQ